MLLKPMVPVSPKATAPEDTPLAQISSTKSSLVVLQLDRADYGERRTWNDRHSRLLRALEVALIEEVSEVQRGDEIRPRHHLYLPVVERRA